MSYDIRSIRPDVAGIQVDLGDRLDRPALLTLSYAGCDLKGELPLIARVNPSNLQIDAVAKQHIYRPEQQTVSTLLSDFSAYALSVP